MLDWVSGTPAELTLWGTSSSGMPSFRASSHVYTYHQPKKLLIPYMQLKNPSSFQKAKIDLLLSALTYLTIFFLGNYWKSERSKVLTFPYANASGWAKKLHISSSWFDTGSPVSKTKVKLRSEWWAYRADLLMYVATDAWYMSLYGCQGCLISIYTFQKNRLLAFDDTNEVTRDHTPLQSNYKQNQKKSQQSASWSDIHSKIVEWVWEGYFPRIN